MSSIATKLHASSIGYAIFFVINATQIWGGVFPFLPLGFQTGKVTLAFFLSQSLAFCTSFVASAFGSYFFPWASKRMFVTLCGAMVFIGSACIIAIMYVPFATMPLVIVGGLCLGVGCAGLFMLWQRYFSSIPAKQCNYRLIIGTGLASLFYFALYLVPEALTAFLVPVVFLPLCGLCLSLSIREMNFDQPMFEDIPRQHPAVYGRLIKDLWRNALCIGALGFASGLARGVAIIEPSLSAAVNVTSMAGSLLGALALLIMWKHFSFRFSMLGLFRVAYPVVITGLLLFPFVKNVGLSLFAGLTYMVFSLVVMIMMMQCAQISRERGTNPVFVYGFVGGFAYVLQSVGFLAGWFAHDIEILGVGQVALLSIVAAYVLGMSLYVATGKRAFAHGAGKTHKDDQIEFVTYKDQPQLEKTHDATPDACHPAADHPSANPQAHDETNGRKAAGKGGAKTKGKPKTFSTADERVITDRLSKQCYILEKQYGLSARETEVMELIARGRSVASISQDLFISENTVRTHSKHIYTKLDIHSRQELGELLRTIGTH